MKISRFILALLLIGVACLATGCEEGQERLLVVDDAKEAMRIMVRLEENGVTTAALTEAERNRKPVFDISVDAAELNDARRILVMFDLPRTPQPGFAELFNESRLIPTASEEHARLVHATSGELARAFELWDRIVAARVILNIPQDDPYAGGLDERETPTAMVVLRYIPMEGETATQQGAHPISDEDVTKLVQAAIAGVSDQESDVRVMWTAVEPINLLGAGSGRADIDAGGPEDSLVSTGDSETAGSIGNYVLMGTAGAFALLTAIFGVMLLGRRQPDADDADAVRGTREPD